MPSKLIHQRWLDSDDTAFRPMYHTSDSLEKQEQGRQFLGIVMGNPHLWPRVWVFPGMGCGFGHMMQHYECHTSDTTPLPVYHLSPLPPPPPPWEQQQWKWWQWPTHHLHHYHRVMERAAMMKQAQTTPDVSFGHTRWSFLKNFHVLLTNMLLCIDCNIWNMQWGGWYDENRPKQHVSCCLGS